MACVVGLTVFWTLFKLLFDVFSHGFHVFWLSEASFFANLASVLRTLREFGFFMGMPGGSRPS